MQSKSRVQAVADIAAAWLTIIAIVAGGLTFFYWLNALDLTFGMERAVTVMVITCPHALGLAVPLVISGITGIAAISGLIIRNRVAFEEARDLDVIVFDKTGTLTEGKFGVQKIITLGDWSEEDLVSKVASIEQHGKHGLATAIVDYAKDKKIPILKLVIMKL